MNKEFKKRYSQFEIRLKFRSGKCLECQDGTLIKIENGWLQKFKCQSCGIEYEFAGSDMGQTWPSLVSNASIAKNTEINPAGILIIAKEINRLLNEGIEIHPNSPIHDKLKNLFTKTNIDDIALFEKSWLDKVSIKHDYLISTLSEDGVYTYIFGRRLGNLIEILLSTSMTNEIEFSQEVEMLANLFNVKYVIANK